MADIIIIQLEFKYLILFIMFLFHLIILRYLIQELL